MANTVVKTFDYTGGTQSFTMPAGYHSDVALYMWGAGGGGGGADGNGPGGTGTGGWYWAGTITINEGDAVSVAVGGGGLAGGSGTNSGAGTGGRGRYNITIDGNSYSFGGARGGNAGPSGWSGGGGGGGAATAVVINGTQAYVAAGGGGGGGGSNNRGGNPGYTINSPSSGSQGTNGQDCNGDGAGGGGGGGGIVGGFGGTMGYDNSSGGLGGYTGTSSTGGVQPVGNTPNGTTNQYWSSPIGVGTIANGGGGRAVMVFTASTFGGVKVGGDWKGLNSSYVKVAGEWKTLQNAWVKVNGQWRSLKGFAAPAIEPTFSGGNYGPAYPEIAYPAGAPQGSGSSTPGDGIGGDGGQTGDGGGGGGGGGGGCFLTTATVMAMGLPDDCEELALARMVRDTQMNSDKDRAAVQLYYKVAPLIVERNAEWTNFYADVLVPITKLIKEERYAEAINLYKYATVKLIDSHATRYSDRYIVETIFDLVSKNKHVPYFAKYACVKAYFMLKLSSAKAKIKYGILRKSIQAAISKSA